MSPFTEIHVALGDSAAASLREANTLSVGAKLLPLRDHLGCGPLPPLRFLAQWRDLRRAFWESVERSDPDWPSFDLPDDLAILGDARSITLWLGTGLADQLQLAWLVQALRLLGADPARLSTVQFSGVGRKVFEVVSVAVLNPAEIAAHPPASPLTEAAIAELDAAWTAMTAPDPAALAGYLAGSSSALPLLPRALRTLFGRYPDHRSGLGMWDRHLLKHTAGHGPSAARIIGYTMAAAMDTPDWVGDSYLFHRLQRLGAADIPHPLVSLNRHHAPMRETTAEITETGRAVLRGKANAVRLNGIDDWVAGVHLDSRAGRVWFNQDGALVAGA
jgi:Domain of unknown function (DUF1835)